MTGLFDDIFYNMANTRNVSYPPANAYQDDSGNITVELAVAGFKQEELEVSFENSELVVSGKRSAKDDKLYILKGIASREFTRTFTVRGAYNIEAAELDHGILTICLVNVSSQRKKIPISLKKLPVL